MKSNKKAQEEIVGFIAIVLIIAIIMIILLGIYIRRYASDTNTESRDIYQFLESTMQYTTPCALSYEPAYLKLNELISECYSGLSICISGDSPCETAEKLLKDIITTSFLLNEQAYVKGYKFKSSILENKDEKEIIALSEGNCSKTIRGAEFLIPSSEGTISNSLKLCF